MRTIFSSLFVVFATSTCFAAELPLVTEVEHQPLVAATERLLEALEFVGAPLPAEDTKALQGALKETDAKVANRTIQRVLDAHCVVGVTINPESRVSVVEGPVAKRLIQGGWATFLIKVQNDAGITPQLKPESPNAAPLYMRGSVNARQKPLTDEKEKLVKPEDVPHRFLDIAMFDKQPLKPTLSGLALEYRIIQLYSREIGRREAKLGFNVGQGTQDLGFRNTVPILFNAAPSVEVVLGVKDFDGEPTSAAFVIRDRRGNVFPNPARRLSPDFFFHNQIYRADGESVNLSPGEYSVEVSRGPEYIVQTHSLTVKPGVSQKADYKLTRWTHPATRGWFSGDHHVHAAGCAHYDSPTEGVTPADMLRHILGEDLNVGCVLSWGPCWYSQKQYFEGKTSALSRPNYLMRYDIEVSGFPSSHAGHLCLLRLTEDDYPNTKVLEDWPSWTLPVLKWGKEQGGVVGYSHSGWGLQLPDIMPDGSREMLKGYGGAPDGWKGKAADKLPDYAMPRFDGIGANEYVVTVAHDVCHFISAVDTPSIWELNVWYHTLNAGFRARISGETDFPCIYGDKVGLGRIYVKLNKDQPLDFDNWILGVRDGRSYCGDGLSHVLDFAVADADVTRSVSEGERSTDAQSKKSSDAKSNPPSLTRRVTLGEPGPTKKLSTLELAKSGNVKVSFDVNALLAEKMNDNTESIRKRRLDAKPYWHIERCRIGQTRDVPVEIIVNGQVAATKNITADGKTQPLSFDIPIKHSSWVAVRILPGVHTNPIWVEVGGKPVRASKKSIDWCQQAVEVCWNAKQNNIRESERAAAKTAYDEAAKIYEARLKEAVAD
ncbi:MAG: CehA/McbA family metallohydrolase [Planctomycetaceae bacterium]